MFNIIIYNLNTYFKNGFNFRMILFLERGRSGSYVVSKTYEILVRSIIVKLYKINNK